MAVVCEPRELWEPFRRDDLLEVGDPLIFLVLKFGFQFFYALIDADLPEAVRSWNREYAFPHLVISSTHTIMQTIEKRYGDKLPVARGDFSDYWTDSFGTTPRKPGCA